MPNDTRFLLDTNVVSEVTRPKPDARVMAWLAAADEDRLYLSVATLAEINRGVDLLPAGKKQRVLRDWLINGLIPRFDGRILPVDVAVALHWGTVTAQSKTAGREIEAVDALIAATAGRHSLTLVTRKISDFAALALPVFDPWSGPTA
jgi:toxin FitB